MKKNTKEHHGMHGTCEYHAWCSMIARCENTKYVGYENYGGRGISVCDRWRRSFSAFFMDVGPKPEPGYSLDRKNNDGNYEPGNVRWTTRKIQRMNCRRVRYIEAFGQTKCLKDWSAERGMSERTINSRLKTGLTAEEALTLGDLRVSRTPSLYGKGLRHRHAATGRTP